MKICFLAGANSVHSYKWVKFFAEKGHEVHWISLTPNVQGEIDGVYFYRPNQSFPFNFLKIKKILQIVKPDILHAHYAGVNGFLAALTKFHPLVVTVWGSDVLFTGRSKIKGPFVRYALKKADLITCDAEYLKKIMAKMGMIEEGKISIIYFGVDTEKFRPVADKDAQAMGNKVISLRSLEPIYDIETLIRASALVLKDLPQTLFIIAGQGSDEKKMKDLSRELGVSKNVKFVGLVNQDDLPSLLNSADVYVSTALSDAGIAASTAEAMACGLPVVITNTGENEKWVKDGQGGYLIPTKLPEALADRILFLLKKPDLRKRFGERNRKTIEEGNDYYKEMLKMEQIYESLV